MPRSVKNALAAYTTHNTVQLILGGAPYFSCLKDMIDRAKSSIHLQVYIFDDDTTGHLVANALIEAAERGEVGAAENGIRGSVSHRRGLLCWVLV